MEFGRPPDADRVARALRYARLLADSQPFAVAAAFSAKLAEATDEIRTALSAYSEDMLQEVREAPPDIRANAERHFANLLEICTLIFGEDEADYLRRRSRVAPTAA